MSELKKIMQDVDPSESGLRPPPAELEELIESCSHLVRALSKCAVTLDLDDLEETIRLNAECVRAAAGKVPPDRESYIRCAHNLQRAHDALAREYHRCWGERNPRERARDIICQASDRIEDVAGEEMDEADRALLEKARKHLDEAEELLDTNAEAAIEEAAEALQCALLVAKNIADRARKLQDAEKEEEGKPPGGRVL